MSLHYDRDCVLLATGQLADLRLERGTGRVRLPNGQEVEVQHTVTVDGEDKVVPLPLLGAHLSPLDGAWLAIEHESGRVVVNGVDTGWPSTGDGSAIWDKVGCVHVQRGGNPPPEMVDLYRPGINPNPVLSYPAPYASTGLHRIEAGYAISETDPRRQAIQVHQGVTLYNCSWQDTPEGRYVVGLADGDVGGRSGGVVVLVSPFGNLSMLPYETQQNPRIAVAGDIWIAVSGLNSPEPWETFHQMVPYRAFVPPPVLLPPIVVGPQRPTWIVDVEAILTPRGNGISTIDGPKDGKLFEDCLWVETPEDEARLEAIYFGPEAPRGGVSRPDYGDKTQAMALRNRVPICVCDEWGEKETAEWIFMFENLGCRAVWMCELYRPVGESQEAYRTRTRSRLEKAAGL